MRLDILKWNDYTFKKLTKEAELIYCFLEAHCSTAGFLRADELDIANGIGLEVERVLTLLVISSFSL